jgi:hypothetical protein
MQSSACSRPGRRRAGAEPAIALVVGCMFLLAGRAPTPCQAHNTAASSASNRCMRHQDEVGITRPRRLAGFSTGQFSPTHPASGQQAQQGPAGEQPATGRKSLACQTADGRYRLGQPTQVNVWSGNGGAATGTPAQPPIISRIEPAGDGFHHRVHVEYMAPEPGDTFAQDRTTDCYDLAAKVRHSWTTLAQARCLPRL